MAAHHESSEQDTTKFEYDQTEMLESEPMVEVFSKPGNIKIMRVLVDALGTPMSVADIAEQANIDEQTFYNNEELLKEYDLIEEADKIGNARRFRAKKESEPVQAVIHLYDALIEAAN